MTDVWMVVEEKGEYSDYGMRLLSSHDSEGGAKAEAKRLRAEWKARFESYQRAVEETPARFNVIAYDCDTLNCKYPKSPTGVSYEDGKEELERAYKWIKEQTGEFEAYPRPSYSVQGPFPLQFVEKIAP